MAEDAGGEGGERVVAGDVGTAPGRLTSVGHAGVLCSCSVLVLPGMGTRKSSIILDLTSNTVTVELLFSALRGAAIVLFLDWSLSYSPSS